MNYIDKLALAIHKKAHPTDGETEECEDMPLFRIYALLALCLQNTVTNADVHDAWSVWCSGVFPNHKSIVPFEHLTPEVQELDSKYRDAILAVVEENGGLV